MRKQKWEDKLSFLFPTEHAQNTESCEHFIFVLGDLVPGDKYKGVTKTLEFPEYPRILQGLYEIVH